MSKHIIMVMILSGFIISLATYIVKTPNKVQCLSSNSMSSQELLATNGNQRGWPVQYMQDEMPWICSESGETSRDQKDFIMSTYATKFMVNWLIWSCIMVGAYTLVIQGRKHA